MGERKDRLRRARNASESQAGRLRDRGDPFRRVDEALRRGAWDSPKGKAFWQYSQSLRAEAARHGDTVAGAFRLAWVRCPEEG
jgi:hypothetical protein